MAYGPDQVDKVTCEVTDRFELQTEGIHECYQGHKDTKFINVAL